MKNATLLLVSALIFACSATDENITSEEVDLAVDHYKTTSAYNGTAFVIYENGSLGDENARVYGQIENFNFEPGYTYSLRATKTPTENAGTNTKTIRYKATSVNSRQAVRPDAEFRIPMIKFINGRGMATFIRRQADSTFILGNEIPFNCNYFCTDLDRAIEQKNEVTGIFKHGPDGSYLLMSLID